MEEAKDDMGLVDSPAAPTIQWWPSSLIDKLRSISLVSSDESSSSKTTTTLDDSATLACQRASQTLWETGKLSDPIPDGFYFVTPSYLFREKLFLGTATR